jgi:protein-S-isoprenylcysteine O-methyltransferase Ste14
MRAAEWEFRHRFWVYFAIFGGAFGCYAFDHTNVIAWLVRIARGTLHDASDLPITPIRAALFVAGAIAIVGAALRTWAAAYLRTEVVHDTALHSDRLVADGPYRHLRNPLYVGVLLAGLGLSALASRVGAAVLLVGMPWFTLRLIGREEAELEAAGGESYRAYKAAVPRLLPSLRPRLPRGDARPRWGQALLGETFFWAVAASILVFAWTLRIETYYLVLGAAFLVRGLLAMLWWRRRRRVAAPG